MATVKIGDKELSVPHRQSEGGLLRMKNTIEAELAVGAAKGVEIPDAWAKLVHCYVGHNEGVTVEWLLSKLPADCTEILTACVIASGVAVAKPGEAGSQ